MCNPSIFKNPPPADFPVAAGKDGVTLEISSTLKFSEKTHILPGLTPEWPDISLRDGQIPPGMCTGPWSQPCG